MMILKGLIFILFSIWFIASMVYNYLDYKKGGLKWNLPEKFRNSPIIMIYGGFCFGLITFAESAYYNIKYNPTEFIFSK